MTHIIITELLIEKSNRNYLWADVLEDLTNHSRDILYLTPMLLQLLANISPHSNKLIVQRIYLLLQLLRMLPIW